MSYLHIHRFIALFSLTVMLIGASLSVTFAAGQVTEALSQDVYKKLKQAEGALDAKAYDQALDILKGLRGKKDMSQYETSQMWNLEAYVHYLKEDYTSAVNAYNEVLKYENLAEAVVQSTLKTLAQLYFIKEDYAAALGAVNRLIARLQEPDTSVYMLQGQAYYQLGQYDKALAPIKTAVEKSKAQGQTPKENWLLLLRAVYFERKDYKSMVPLMKELIRYYPKDSYVLTLAAIYSELEDTKKQLALTEVLYEKGYLQGERHTINLANLYLLHGQPYKAAKLLKQETEQQRLPASEANLRLLAQAWYQAREDAAAIEPMRRAAEMSGDGELFIRLAQSYINLEQWPEAAEAIQNGLLKGGVNKPNTAKIMLGMALFNQHKLDAARTTFAEVAKSEAAGDRQTANTWLTFVDSEMRRSETENQQLPEFERSKEAEENIRELNS